MMKLELRQKTLDNRASELAAWLRNKEHRLGMISSIDGKQLITLLLDPAASAVELWESPVQDGEFTSLTPGIPQCHWFERTVWDMFGLMPKGHPRLKHNLLHEPYDADFVPLGQASASSNQPADHRIYHHLRASGESLYELPVGPIHAGIIEPGHFLFSCLGEQIVNLEIRLGYVHRSVEKRLTEIPWQKACHVTEVAASDTVAANALAHAIAIESILEISPGARVQYLRTISLEIERVAMHIADLGGLAADIGFTGMAAPLSRMRGMALGLAELLAGTRFQKSFIKVGGLHQVPSEQSLRLLRERAVSLKKTLRPILDMFLSNQDVCQRMQKVGRVSNKLAMDFGLVGVAARASGIKYDTRMYFQQGIYPSTSITPNFALENDGDVYARAKVRVAELYESLDLIDKLLGDLPAETAAINLPATLPANKIGLAIVEAHRGELIHLVFTDEQGKIKRYAIKDPSFNNWTALAIAVRNNLVADFPLCNKSFSLSYSGHDL